VDGAQANDSGVAGMSAPAAWAKARKQALKGRNSGRKVREMGESEERDFI